MINLKLEVLWHFIKKMILQEEKYIETWVASQLSYILANQIYCHVAQEHAIHMPNYNLSSGLAAE